MYVYIYIYSRTFIQLHTHKYIQGGKEGWREGGRGGREGGREGGGRWVVGGVAIYTCEITDLSYIDRHDDDDDQMMVRSEISIHV